MRTADFARLILLGAIWGGSFVFQRVVAPVLGPFITADLRLLIGGISLILYFRIVRLDLDWRLHWQQYIIIGAINSAIPFTLFAYAAMHIPASYSAILNSAAPLFGALFSTLWLKERLTWRKILGLIIGAVGVSLVVKIGSVDRDSHFYLAVVGCLIATIFYGFSATYIKKKGKNLRPSAIAGASQLAAGMILLPTIGIVPLSGSVSLPIALNVLGLALICGSVAYLLYYRLLADVGPTKTLTVTFLMPVFGMFWSVIFLNETVTISMILGTTMIILGIGLMFFEKKTKN